MRLNGGVTHRDRSPAPSLLYVVKQLELVTRAHLDAIVRESGVTALQYTALTVLERREGMTSADLARHSFVRAQSAADLVGGLERRGLIRRDPDPTNRRRRLISLTEDGRAQLRRSDLRPDATVTLVVSGLTPATVRVISRAGICD